MENGGGTGVAVCIPRPGTPVDADADLDGIWRPSVRAAVDDVEPRRRDLVYAIDATTASEPIGRPRRASRVGAG